jgi:hypothetical protein
MILAAQTDALLRAGGKLEVHRSVVSGVRNRSVEVFRCANSSDLTPRACHTGRRSARVRRCALASGDPVADIATASARRESDCPCRDHATAPLELRVPSFCQQIFTGYGMISPATSGGPGGRSAAAIRGHRGCSRPVPGSGRPGRGVGPPDAGNTNRRPRRRALKDENAPFLGTPERSRLLLPRYALRGVSPPFPNGYRYDCRGPIATRPVGPRSATFEARRPRLTDGTATAGEVVSWPRRPCGPALPAAAAMERTGSPSYCSQSGGPRKANGPPSTWESCQGRPSPLGPDRLSAHCRRWGLCQVNIGPRTARL